MSYTRKALVLDKLLKPIPLRLQSFNGLWVTNFDQAQATPGSNGIEKHLQLQKQRFHSFPHI